MVVKHDEEVVYEIDEFENDVILYGSQTINHFSFNKMLV